MGAPKKYTQKTLFEAVKEYFASITREVVITERVPTGKKDAWGHTVYKTVKVKNNLGEVAKRTEYLVPPTLGGLCIHLGIDNSTWTRWRNADKYPEFQKVIEYVDDRLIAWLQEQVVIRDKIAGVKWALEVNHGQGKEQKEKNPEVSVVIEGGNPAWRL